MTPRPQGAADIHIHTTYTDGAPTPSEVVARAIELGLDVIAITDHDSVEGALATAESAGDRLEVVIGEEVSTRQGHVLGLFLTRTVAAGRDVWDTVEEIHALGGLAIPAHPYLVLGGARGVGERGIGLAWDAIEVENGSPGAWLANRRARRARQLWASSETGGSDAHILDAVGTVVTMFPGRSALDLRAAIQSGTTQAMRRRLAPVVAARTLTRSVVRRLSGEADRERATRGVRAARR